MINRLIFISLTCCSLAVKAQESTPSGPPPLPLDEAVNLAQANNRQVKNAILTAAIDEDKIAEARTYRLPSLSIYALGSEQPLSQQHKVGLNIQLAKLAKAADEQ